MRKNALRVGIALVLAPIFAVYVVPTFFCASSFVVSGSCDALFGWTPVFLVFAFGATLVVGLPLYVALNQYGLRKWWHRGLVGMVVGCVTALAIYGVDASILWYWLALFAAPIGFVTGVLFSLLAPKKALSEG